MSNPTGSSKRDKPFQDPLENYDPPKFDDPLERALAEETVAAIEFQPFVCVSPDTKVADVLKQMVDLNVSCVLVAEDQALVGVFSQRDALNKVALEFDIVKDKTVSEVMTSNPIFVYETDSSAAALSVMAATGFRHVPVVNLDEKLVGILSPSRVTAFLRSYFEDSAGDQWRTCQGSGS